MTLKEIKSMSNEDLIYVMCVHICNSRVLKCNISDVEKITKEMHKRKMIDNPNELFEKWVKRYKL